ncbi:ATP-binding protein [[Kitasatospora] papulosa]|uniref:AlbA family DNA-binding domain-containing protein n=1 Tax=[Kitasatospora] papulosa TaxID=1464011 RepID=UPI00225C0846|nr:ATP-binding protein [[Kitasatospora] papulosa]MCX4415644.1 ATP-binding protein [[Kitasatospora] papulosa]
MVLNISTDRPLRSPRQLLELAEAIRDAGEHDENDWIEWKSSYDLTKKEVKATIARHIIGMANRPPEKSSTTCQGYGYIVIGVEPKNVEGVASIDLADLDSGLQAYLGHQGPEWSASYVTLDGKTVLILTIEPPEIGDPIHTLHKEFGNYAPGMIFSRRAGRTLQANPGEVLSLTRRASTQGIASQNMVITSEVEVTEIPLWRLNGYIEEQVAMRERALQSRGVQRRPAIGMASMDGRTEGDYQDEVRKYLGRCREYLGNVARKVYVQNGLGAVRLTISNADQISHQGVRVELAFPAWLTVILAEDYEDAYFREPRIPEPLGSGIPRIVKSGDTRIMNAAYLGPREMETSVEDGLVVFNVASVRAEGKVRLPTIHLIAESWGDGEGVATWAITALNSGGRAKGSLQLAQNGLAAVAYDVERPNKDC